MGEGNSLDTHEKEADIKLDVKARRFMQRTNNYQPKFVHSLILVLTLDSLVEKFVPNEGKCERYSHLSQLH